MREFGVVDRKDGFESLVNYYGADLKVPLPCGGGFRGWVFKALALKCYLKQRQGFEFVCFLLGNYFYFLLRKNTLPQTPSAREGALKRTSCVYGLPRKNSLTLIFARNDEFKF